MVVPCVLSLYKMVGAFAGDNLSALAAQLRDGLLQRFKGIKTNQLLSDDPSGLPKFLYYLLLTSNYTHQLLA